MPLFISDDELARHSNDVSYVAAKADDFIRGLQAELETVKAAADAAAITAEQTCSLLEQKFLSLSSEFSKLESQNAQLQSSLDDRLSELAEVQAQKHQLHLQSIGKDGEIERMTMEVSELHKSKRQLIELMELKDSEISEKNATISSYLDRIVNLTDNMAEKEARVSEVEAELARSVANCARLSQEKELIERHNTWLNEELTAKVDSLIKLRRTHADLNEEMSAKLADSERQLNECSSSLKWHKERVKELELKLTSLQEELCSCKDAAAANEERFSAEISTINKLVELYKESSEEWSQKAGELEGVIKALETHLSQVENDYKERLEKAVSERNQLEKEATDLKNKLEKCEAEVESSRKANELNILPLSSLTTERWKDPYNCSDTVDDNNTLVPRIPVGVSGTALAASLLRDGWSLAKMYAKYQEAVDALRHEQLGRKESEAILQRVLCELEEKAGIILDERAEYDRMAESYSVINQKLQHSISEQANLEKTIQELKVDLRRHERENYLAQKEIVDLQKQVTVLLKECRDIQLCCGSSGHDEADDSNTIVAVGMDVESDAEKVISERLLTFNDINGLVEQNVQLRSLVRDLSDQIENKEMEFKEKFEMELKKHTDEAACKVAVVLQRAEEQVQMIESLHTSVAMYKRLYEEEHKLHSSYSRSSDAPPDDGRKDLLLLLEGSQESAKVAQEKATERLRSLEGELTKSRSEIISLRSERDKMDLDAKFAKERLDSYLKKHEQQENEMISIKARNAELTQLIVDFQRKLFERSEALQASEELSRKLNMEVSVLKHEKEMLSNAEKRACGEVGSLSERVYRLQASLDTIHSAQEVREEARAAERRKQEEYIKQVEREWAEAKKELELERNHVRALTSDREETLKNAMRQVEEMGKELANALHAVSAAETRAAVAEAKLSEVEKKIKTSNVKVANVDDGSIPSSISTTEVVTDLLMAKEEIEKLKEEAQANKEHMLQYKSIAQVNEAALKQMEGAHENFKHESEKLKDSLEAELRSLRERISELDNELKLKSEEVASAASGKEDALTSALTEIACLKEENSSKISQIMALETQVSALKEDLEKEHQRWRSAQANYERQVVLQSETIHELTKASQALASVQQEASDLRKLTDAQKSENNELKARREVEKSLLEELKKEAEEKSNELNEQNKILHNRLEALHIQLAEKDRNYVGISSGSIVLDSHGDSGMQSVINYLRRSKEIAETEISLLKQEKLRLQSQLENALKAAENAQASLHAERANSRALLLSEEEIKSLQLKVREMNLLRESNVQLREENKHNFEECLKLREVAQKAKAHSDNLESLLRERQIEVEACKKEIELERMQKGHLEKRVSEVLERCRNVDVEDYDRMKDGLQQMQEKVKEKESEIEEINNLLSKQQETISKLEQDLAKSELELSQREQKINDVLLNEASLKSELEKQRKLAVQWKKKFENSLKEKEDFSKEKQALSKQIEELKQGKRSMGIVSGEQVMKEKEEKEHRIQILEKTVERQREELRKEKEDNRMEKAKRLTREKAIMDKVKNVEQEKTEFTNKLERHKEALRRLSEELEKLKHAETNLPEGTSVVQILSGTILDDLCAAYVLAVENFQRTATSVSIELGASAASLDASMPDAPVAVFAGQSVSSHSAISSSVGPITSSIAAKAADDKERRIPVSKTNIETRKTGRKLVRPRLVKPDEPQGDVEMSDVDGSNTQGKVASSHESETQRNLTSLSQPSARKRLASSASELSEQPLDQGETNSDAGAPVVKKPKGSDSSHEGTEGQSVAPSETMVIPSAVEEASNAVGDVTQGSNEEVIAEKDEAETGGEKSELPKDSEQIDDPIEPQNEKINVGEESVDKTNGIGGEFDGNSKDQAVEDNQQSIVEFESEKEEGELVPDDAEGEEGADTSNIMGSPEIGEVPEVGTTPVASPARIEDEAVVAGGVELGEMNSPEAFNEEKNDEGDVVEETIEGSDKSNDGNDQIAGESDQIPETASVTVESTTATVNAEAADVSKQVTETEEVKQVSPASNSSTVVNLAERAKERAMLRQSGTAVLSPPGSRGRGRAVRGRAVRGARGGRTGRGHTPGQQG
ncbi:nuclear-pore anchor isoform X2 [Hevea brasiliensis]|uniref:nuclear-pore anchor isoform X2 n=1 Tax=Hevea brasiliensis TaxID=3981 RepID=UPI0025FB3D72|nr:nuclear-pore anchor isoform X2 [Hevea brasiliensis]